jgi:hypothetical protein
MTTQFKVGDNVILVSLARVQEEGIPPKVKKLYCIGMVKRTEYNVVNIKVDSFNKWHHPAHFMLLSEYLEYEEYANILTNTPIIPVPPEQINDLINQVKLLME